MGPDGAHMWKEIDGDDARKIEEYRQTTAAVMTTYHLLLHALVEDDTGSIHYPVTPTYRHTRLLSTDKRNSSRPSLRGKGSHTE